jgi:hypothetical protein
LLLPAVSSALREKFKTATVTFSHIPHDLSFTVELQYLSVLPQWFCKRPWSNWITNEIVILKNVVHDCLTIEMILPCLQNI